jgi:hypothetical protein
MKPRSEAKLREEASRGKNEPMAKNAKVIQKQNAEVGPTREAAKAQPGTDEAKR